MNTQSFESILDTPADAVERPKPLPAGTYDCIVKGLFEQGESSQKNTPFVKFTYAIQAAGEDVDSDELEAIGGIADKTIKDTYYTTPDAVFRLLSYDHDVVCGIYPRKNPTDSNDWPCELRGRDEDKSLIRDGNLYSAMNIPFGFVRFKRSALERMVESYRGKDLDFLDHDGGKKHPTVALFQLMIREGVLCSEDYSFCYRWTIGINIGCDRCT
jgi:hypothetical protein